MNISAPAPTYWKRCSSCKKEIKFSTPYYLCSISTCRGKRLGLSFCTVECWDAHLGFAAHRNAYAEEETSPSIEAYLKEQNDSSEETTQNNSPASASAVPTKRVIISGSKVSTTPSGQNTEIETDTLVVVSKVKKLVRDLSEFNTSQDAIEALTEKVIVHCKRGIENARAAGRKTMMARDIE